MSDSRRDSKPRKLRFQITGGSQDLKDMESLLRDELTECGWEVNFYEYKPFGDHGPMHKLSLGFIESLN